jgi:hypothetical protein
MYSTFSTNHQINIGRSENFPYMHICNALNEHLKTEISEEVPSTQNIYLMNGWIVLSLFKNFHYSMAIFMYKCTQPDIGSSM